MSNKSFNYFFAILFLFTLIAIVYTGWQVNDAIYGHLNTVSNANPNPSIEIMIGLVVEFVIWLFLIQITASAFVMACYFWLKWLAGCRFVD